MLGGSRDITKFGFNKWRGSGPIEAFVNAMVETLNEPISVRGYYEHALGKGSDARAICVLAIDGWIRALVVMALESAEILLQQV